VPTTMPRSAVTAALVVVATTVVLGAGLAGCGGSSSSGTPAPTPPAPLKQTKKLETYHGVNRPTADKLEHELAVLPGVARVTYYDKTKVLEVDFDHATAAQKLVINKLISAR
jgi:hypothetical protein